MQLTDELASLKRRFDVFRNVTGNVGVEVSLFYVRSESTPVCAKGR